MANARESADIVAAAELKSVKDERRIYERRTPNIFFLSNKQTALARIAAASEEKTKQCPPQSATTPSSASSSR